MSKSRARIKFKWDVIHHSTLLKLLDSIKEETLLYRSGPGVRHIYVDAAPSKNSIGGHIYRVDDNGNKYLMGYRSKTLSKRRKISNR